MYKGKAQDGGAGASRAMAHERCRRMLELKEILGYMPFPGSLNLSLDRPFDYSQPCIEAEVLNPQSVHNFDAPWVKEVFQFWPITIAGIEAHAVCMKRRHRAQRQPTFMEVYAPVRLRDFGDKFEISHR